MQCKLKASITINVLRTFARFMTTYIDYALHYLTSPASATALRLSTSPTQKLHSHHRRAARIKPPYLRQQNKRTLGLRIELYTTHHSLGGGCRAPRKTKRTKKTHKKMKMEKKRRRRRKSSKSRRII